MTLCVSREEDYEECPKPKELVIEPFVPPRRRISLEKVLGSLLLFILVGFLIGFYVYVKLNRT